jgi:hypothetical protein
MRRYPFTVPGLVRLTTGGGPSVVERLRSGIEPLVMAILHRFEADGSVQAVNSDEMNTLHDEEYPREWWVRTAFISASAPDPDTAKEKAWLTIEYSRWEESEEWTMQVFFRVSEVEFSLSTDSSETDPILNLVGSQLPAGDIQIIEELLRAHFGGPAAQMAPVQGTLQYPMAL